MPTAPGKRTQFYAMLGQRALYEDGWLACTLHPPLSGWGKFDQDVWELYHVEVDRSQSTNLAEQEPERLQAMMARWFELAEEYNGLPLDDRTALEQMLAERPSGTPTRDRYVYYPDCASVPEQSAVAISGRSYTISAGVQRRLGGRRGRDLRPRRRGRRAQPLRAGPTAHLRLQLGGHLRPDGHRRPGARAGRARRHRRVRRRGSQRGPDDGGRARDADPCGRLISVVGVVAGVAGAVHAQQLEEIIVTAERRELSLQETPISVIAFTGEQLELRGVNDMFELANITPNLDIKGSRGTGNTSPTYEIRGISGGGGATGERSVGFYIDNVFMPRTTGPVMRVLDVDRDRGAARPAGHAVRSQ